MNMITANRSIQIEDTIAVTVTIIWVSVQPITLQDCLITKRKI